MSRRKSSPNEVLPAISSARPVDGQIEFKYASTFESTLGTGAYLKLPEAVTIDSKMFRRFLGLEAAPDSQILKFVLRYGPLPRGDSLPHSQPITLWRKYSRIANAIFRAGLAVEKLSDGQEKDWCVICEFLGQPKYMEVIATEPDVAFDRPENAYQKAIRRFRMGVLRMAINKWYNDSPRHSLVDVVRDDLVIAPQSGLLGIIIQQIAQAIVTSHWAICSACAAPYQPERKPRKGQRRYCPACRRADIPHLHAVRDYRQRASRARPTSRG